MGRGTRKKQAATPWLYAPGEPMGVLIERMGGLREPSCGLRDRLDLDFVAELGDAVDEMLELGFGLTPVEIVATEILMGRTVFQHVIDRGQHRSRHGTMGFFLAMLAAYSMILRLVVTIFFARGADRSLHHGGLQPSIAFAQTR